MSNNRSRDDFLRFLDYLGDKGLLPAGTASSRKATANKVTAILSDDEAVDVTAIDLDEIMRRFDNLNQHQYTPESLQTYKSRMKTALEDFRNYCENPLSFKPLGQGRAKQKGTGEKQKNVLTVKNEARGAPEPIRSTSHLPNVSVLPIPLRAGLTVQIAGLPFDLTPSEARKIANIVLAHAVDE